MKSYERKWSVNTIIHLFAFISYWSVFTLHLQIRPCWALSRCTSSTARGRPSPWTSVRWWCSGSVLPRTLHLSGEEKPGVKLIFVAHNKAHSHNLQGELSNTTTSSLGIRSSEVCAKILPWIDSHFFQVCLINMHVSTFQELLVALIFLLSIVWGRKKHLLKLAFLVFATFACFTNPPEK